MLGHYLSWHIFLLPFLDLIVKTHPTLHDSSHGFISKNPRYFDNLAHLHEEMSSVVTGINNPEDLRFEPPILDFKQRPVGVPHLQKVTVFNTKNSTIHLLSVSGNTLHFHSSFFESKKIPPNGNTTFNVVFLGRTEGFKETDLFIHTSEGYVKYNVRGVSTFSQYRIRPLVGVKLPLNSTFAPLIHMHNPYLEPIQISEIYCMGDGFHLELLTRETEASNNLWVIGPQQTKAVIRVRFEAKIVQNYTAYLRIKMSTPNEVLVVPLEVEVTPTPGVFHPRGFVDFGIGGSQDPPKEVKLCLYNPTAKHVKINSVSTLSKAIKVQYFYARLPPVTEMEEGKCAVIGSLTIDWKTAFETKDFSGKIVVRYSNSKTRSKIPYFLTVIDGGLRYDPLLTYYFIDDKTVELSQRSFRARNDYELPLYIYNVSFPDDASSYFKFETFTPKLLGVGEEENLFDIQLRNIKLSDLHLYSQIMLKTNISDISVPLLSYNGRLTIHLPFQDKNNSLNIGLIEFNSKKEIYFMLLNQNPIDIQLTSFHSTVIMAHTELYGCGSEDPTHVLLRDSFQNLTLCQTLKPNHYAIFKMIIKPLNTEEQIAGHVSIETPFEKIQIPVTYKATSGKIHIDSNELVIDNCFPMKICTHPLRIHSTFKEPMIIENIFSLPPGKRIFVKHTGVIPAQTSKIVGHIRVNHNVACHSNCYAGMSEDTFARWSKTFSLTESALDFDVTWTNIFYNRFLNQTENGQKSWETVSLRLDTSDVKGHLFEAKVKTVWPSLLTIDKTLSFPLNQVGNVTFANLTINNPTNHNLLIHLVLGGTYPNVKNLFNKIPGNILQKNKKDSHLSMGFFFGNETRFKQSTFLWEKLGIESHAETVPVLLKPNENYTIQIGFNVQQSGSYSGLLFIRNNLTVLETVDLHAEAVVPVFKFGNRKPGSLQALTFDLTPKHLKECEKKTEGAATSNFAVKRSFTARNAGDVPIYVNGFYLNDYPCEGYGFRIIDCESFVLAPNDTKKVDVMFTPDFTMSKISRTLIIDTSLNYPVNYTLFTTVPPAYLGLCSEIITRPAWEKYLGYLVICFMSLHFVIVLLVATLDAEQTRRDALGSFTPTVQPVLDLRFVARQTKEEIHATKTEVEVKDEEKCEKIENKFVEDKPKPVLERYTVLVPTVGRCKRKLAKKNSNELEEQELTEKEVKKEKHVEKPKKEWKESLKVEKQSSCHKEKEIKKVKKLQEEETSSSSAAESSCSNSEERQEKEKKPKVVEEVKIESPKPKLSEVLHQIPEPKPLNHCVKIKHKSLQKITKPGEKLHKNLNHNYVEYQIHNKHSHLRENKKREKGKDRDKKSIYHKNKDKSRQSDKHSRIDNNNFEKSKNPICFNIPLPPPTTTSSVWGESRAKFSDVVARSDTTKLITNKPVVYVEPYKQLVPELGPIGSRPERRSSIDNIRSGPDEGNRIFPDRYRLQNDYLPASGFPRDANNSFFSDEIRLDTSNKDSCYVDRLGWGYGNSNMESKVANNSMEDPWNQSLLNSSSYWDSFNPLLLTENPSNPPNKPSLINDSNRISQQTVPSYPSSASYLWGASPVWQPWAPEISRTPTRTPPGFDDILHQKQEENPTPHLEPYGGFNMATNLWNQNSPWN